MIRFLYASLIVFLFTQCSEEQKPIEMEFVTIPEGRFFFGSEVGAEHEKPIVPCKVLSFQLSTTEVSNAQFEAFVKETGYVTDGEKRGGFVYTNQWEILPEANWRKPKGKKIPYQKWKDLPVVQVSYRDALAYCDWAGYRLPTEIEWEYAAKMGKLNPANANIMQANKKNVGAAAVKSNTKDQMGIHHQLGNVWEWCADVYNSEIHDKLSLHSTTEPFDVYEGRSYDPLKRDVSDTLRVIKGGSFLCQAGHCEGYRPEARQSAEQSEAYFHIGFRVVKDIP
ncbi:MAG: formylglycine-generating enzyme family protein [bacterium]|nr:formylglycine-generating enzyme family protein [bacterium]